MKLHKSSAPKRPPRIILLGPPGAGKDTLARRVADKYNLVYVKIAHIVKDLIRTEGTSDLGRSLKNRLKNGDDPNDELIIEMTKKRLDQADCQINGWILDGCPSTVPQIEMI